MSFCVALVPWFILAAKHRSEADPAVILISIVVFGVIAIAIVVREASAHYHVTMRGGLPYCPNCNRQVSFRRDHCRSCGYRFKTYKTFTAPAQADPAPGPTQGELAAQQRARQREEAHRAQAQKQAVERALANRARRLEREKWYRDRGIEPGPFAWFKALPDVAQAAIIGVGIAAPIVGLLVMLLRN